MGSRPFDFFIFFCNTFAAVSVCSYERDLKPKGETLKWMHPKNAY